MAETKVWCWEAAQARHGPDWRLVTEVAPAGADNLARIAAGATLSGYTSCGRVATYCLHHQQTCQIHTLIDTPNAAAYQQNLAGGPQTNLWVYHVVEIHDTLIELESGYGGRDSAYHRIETAFLLDLFAQPAITLERWRILAGGNGYDYRVLREGVGIDAFRAYLR